MLRDGRDALMVMTELWSRLDPRERDGGARPERDPDLEAGRELVGERERPKAKEARGLVGRDDVWWRRSPSFHASSVALAIALRAGMRLGRSAKDCWPER